jgi:hypothetical protein
LELLVLVISAALVMAFVVSVLPLPHWGWPWSSCHSRRCAAGRLGAAVSGLVMALAILSQPRVAVELLVAMAIFLMPSLVARWSRGWPLVCCAAKQIDRG